jgi:nicotinate phosphoribosyltransferase
VTLAAAPVELLVDRYELTMAASYLAEGRADDRVAFELSVRELPRDRGYLLAAGLEQVVDYLRDLSYGPEALAYLERSGTCPPPLLERLASQRFDGDLDAIPEGTVVHAGEPLLRVEGGRLICQLVETYLLNVVNFETLIATKAARMVEAAAGRPVVDFGFRRAHGPDAGLLAARAAYIGGCVATATVAAGMLWDIPTSGTMAHSYVMGFASEVDAFTEFLREHGDTAALLIDTYNPVRGARRAAEASRAAGVAPRSVRLDSGNVATLATQVRAILDEEGMGDTEIFASGDLDEHVIAGWVSAGVPVAGFGVGTRLVTSFDVPALGGVYKLVESDGRAVMKLAGEKSTLPGRHQVFRGDDGDVIGLVGEDLPGTPLLEPVLRGGAPVAETPPVAAVRDRAAVQRAALPSPMRALTHPTPLRPRLSPQLTALKERLS